MKMKTRIKYLIGGIDQASQYKTRGEWVTYFTQLYYVIKEFIFNQYR